MRVPRVKKRDSREFIRRKTLLPSVQENAEVEGKEVKKVKEKIWEGGFHERRDTGIESDQESEASSPSPLRSTHASSRLDGIPSETLVHSDLTLTFEAFRLADSPLTPLARPDHDEKENELSSPGSDTENGEDDDVTTDDDSLNGDSDKENTAVPRSSGTETEEEDAGPVQDGSVIMGLGSIGDHCGDGVTDEEGQSFRPRCLCRLRFAR